MFGPFLAANPEDKEGSVRNVKSRAAHTLETSAPDVHKLLSNLGGKSFTGGLYRVHTFRSSLYWTKQLRDYFPNYPNIYCYGFDWAGCMYAASKKGRTSMLYLFDPADLRVHELQQSVMGIHNEDLVLYRNETLLTKKFKAAMKHCNLTTLAFDECLGYTTSLFLGGKDTVKNRSLWSLEVYWQLQNELFDAVHSPDETEVG
jgi:Domain of unknown function (DUF1851)